MTENLNLIRLSEAEVGDLTLATIRRYRGKRTQTVHIAVVDHYYGHYDAIWVEGRCGINGNAASPHHPMQPSDLCGSCLRSIAFRLDIAPAELRERLTETTPYR